MVRKLSFAIALCLLLLVLPLLVLAQQQERVDLNVIHKIKVAEFGRGGGGAGGPGGAGPNSRVMELIHQMCDRFGPRLTNSPQFRAAGNWAVDTLKEWGMTNVHLEKWATPADNKIPSWQYTYYSGNMVEPDHQAIIGVPVAWTAGTNGPVAGEAILAIISTAADMDRLKGKLKGKIALTSEPFDLAFPATPLASRYTPEQLAEIATELIPTGGIGGRGGQRGGRAGMPANMTMEEMRALQQRRTTFFKDEGALLTLTASARGESGTLFGGGAQNRMDTTNLPQISITAENYNRIARLLQHNTPVKLQFDVKVDFDTSNTDSFNVIADLPGTTRPDEIVMIGGHFDSWHYGTGATDNAVGSAIAMEVMRLLKTTGLKTDRTVRLALWGGEEQGLLGSAAYVKEHYADPAVMKPTPEHGKLAAYFNIDNGTGRIRGIYLQGNEMARPIFEQWFAPLKDLTPGVVTIRDTTGTDHQSFVAVGLPGFQFIQDPMDYNTRTHHSNMDVYDRIQASDAQQMAVIEAVFTYLAATRAEKFPRVDLPAARPAARGGRGGGGRGGF
jgi:carboxypeptidase Q